MKSLESMTWLGIPMSQAEKPDHETRKGYHGIKLYANFSDATLST